MPKATPTLARRPPLRIEAVIDPHTNTISPGSTFPSSPPPQRSRIEQRRDDAPPTRPLLHAVADPTLDPSTEQVEGSAHLGPDSAEDSAVLLIARGPEQGARHRLRADRATIGRYRTCDIPLDHVTVSRHHAEIHYDGERYVLTDNGSLNGTYHNRQPVDCAELTDGDEVRIGVYRLTFHTRSAAG